VTDDAPQEEDARPGAAERLVAGPAALAETAEGVVALAAADVLGVDREALEHLRGEVDLEVAAAKGLVALTAAIAIATEGRVVGPAAGRSIE
jgi:hypothetical protein